MGQGSGGPPSGHRVKPYIPKPKGKARVLSLNPPPYHHPRILFSAADRADLVARALGGGSGGQAGLEPHSGAADIRAGSRAFADLEARVHKAVYGPAPDAPVRRLLETLACGESAPGAPGPRQAAQEQGPQEVLERLCALVAEPQDPAKVLHGPLFRQLFAQGVGPTSTVEQCYGPIPKFQKKRFVHEGETDTTPELGAKLLFCSCEGGLPETRSPIYCAIKEAAYVAWIRSEEDRLHWLARALSMAASVHLLWYPPPSNILQKNCGGPPGYDKADDSVCQQLALAYDLLYDSMTPAERLSPRRLLLSMGQRRVMTAFEAQQYTRSRGPGISHLYTNGTFGVMTAVLLMVQCAVEGESVEGACDSQGREAPALQHDLEAQQLNCEGVKFWLTHGTAADPTGLTRECPGYFATAMRFGTFPALAAARRGYDIFGATNFYAALSEVVQTSARCFNSTACLGAHDGVDYCGGFGQSEYYLVTKYMFPNDPLADYAYQAMNTNPKGQVGMSGLNKMPFQTALFGMNVASAPITLGDVARAASLPQAFFSNMRGAGTARSNWGDPNGILLYFECRPDMYRLSHGHCNRNDFYMASHGRVWVSAGQYHNTDPEAHSSVLIDGVGQGGCHTSKCPVEFATCWSHIPGKVVDTFDSPRLTSFTGDASVAYKYVSMAPLNTVDKPDPKNPFCTPYSWKEFFLEEPDFGPSLVLEPGSKAGKWVVDNSWAECKVPAVGEFNPVEYAFRTACLVRAPHPYVLIVDDIKKDAGLHTYTWVANTTVPYTRSAGNTKPICLLDPHEFSIVDPCVQAVFARGEDVDPKTGQALKGRPLLLVQVVHAQGKPTGPIRLVHVVKGFPQKLDCAESFEYNRIEIERGHCSDPQFKVLLFPFLEGAGLPSCKFDAGKRVLTVSFGGNTDEILFEKSGPRTIPHLL